MKIDDVRASVSLTNKQWETIISILVPIKDQEMKFEETGEVIKVSDVLTDLMRELKMIGPGDKLEWE